MPAKYVVAVSLLPSGFGGRGSDETGWGGGRRGAGSPVNN